jgi:hypothetical protein
VNYYLSQNSFVGRKYFIDTQKSEGSNALIGTRAGTICNNAGESRLYTGQNICGGTSVHHGAIFGESFQSPRALTLIGKRDSNAKFQSTAITRAPSAGHQIAQELSE